MFKDFKSKFDLICEEATSRYGTGGGLLHGDYVTIRKDALKSPKLKDRPSQFFDKLREIMASDLPLKVGAIKSERPETQHGLFGGAEAPTGYWVDVYQAATPAFFINPMTLPIEVLDLASPEGNNFSPDDKGQWDYNDRSNVDAKELKNPTSETTKQTAANDPNRQMTRKNNSKVQGKSAKDGRSQVKKPQKYKESLDSVEDDMEWLAEAAMKILQRD